MTDKEVPRLDVYAFGWEEFIIAYSKEDAARVLVEEYGWGEDELCDYEWEVLPLDQKFSIHNEESEETIVKTISEWIESEGRGFLATHNF